jgi:lycopene cyclase domain-containing protein
VNLYLLLDLLILAAPLALSFDRKVRFVRRWPAVLASALLIVLVYGIWDAWMSSRGDWAFNPRYAGPARWLWLPPGEWLFFLVVPFSCLFIYEVVRAYLPEKQWRLPAAWWLAPITALLALAVAYREQNYTSTVLLSCAAFLAYAAVLLPELLGSRHFWLGLLATYVPFLIFNGLLTALPVVLYSPRAIWGVRLYTIPLEDFLFSFSMLGFSVLSYRLFLRIPALGSRGPGGAAKP